METRDVVLSFRVPASLKAELQRRADESRRKLADYVRLVLEEHAAEPKKADKTAKVIGGGRKS